MRTFIFMSMLLSFHDVRGMLSVLKYESIDKVWKSVLEGTLFEARTGCYLFRSCLIVYGLVNLLLSKLQQGNIATSRKLFKYLMNHVSWYGPIYYEAFRLEEKVSLYLETHFCRPSLLPTYAEHTHTGGL